MGVRSSVQFSVSDALSRVQNDRICFDDVNGRWKIVIGSKLGAAKFKREDTMKLSKKERQWARVVGEELDNEEWKILLSILYLDCCEEGGFRNPDKFERCFKSSVYSGQNSLSLSPKKKSKKC